MVKNYLYIKRIQINAVEDPSRRPKNKKSEISAPQVVCDVVPVVRRH